MNNFSVHDCFYLEASEVHFYWLHNDPVPNGRLHMHLQLRTYNGRGISVAIKSMRPQGVPFVILAFRRVLPFCARFMHFCWAHTGASSMEDFEKTVKSALRHECVDSVEDCEGF